MRVIGAFLMLIALCVPAAARENSSPIEMRAAQLPDMLTGKIRPDAFFSPTFLNAVPELQIRQIADQLVDQNGALRGVTAVRAETEYNGEVDIGYDRGTVTMQLVAASDAPHFVIGLQVTGVKARDDSLSKLSAEFAALPGMAGFMIARHNGAGGFTPVAAVKADTAFAIGSTFKLWVLAEAAAQVKARRRTWSDVIPLGPASLPSGIAQGWPTGAPITLHSLAILMISISDNTATDTLMAALGRNAIDQRVSQIGQIDVNRALPVLTTLEAFVLKNPAKSQERGIWETGSRDARREMLGRLAPASAMVDRVALSGKPAFIDSVEWFASATAIAATFDTLRQSGSKEAMEILAINRPLPPGEINRFSYVGYKGGSEVGVMSMSYLLQTKAGDWFTVTGSWNNPASVLDERRFEAMMQRAVNMVR